MTAKRFSAILFPLLVFGIIIFIFCFWFMPKADPAASRLKAEQEIYSVLIDGKYYVGNYVFEAHTSNIAIDVQYIGDGVPELQNITLIDFQEKNSQPYLLKNYLTAHTNYVFLNDEEVQQFYTNWNAFANKHPNIHIINSFSRVGFNSSFTQALVLINRNAKSFDDPFEYTGDGLIYLFNKIETKWIEKYQLVYSITG